MKHQQVVVDYLTMLKSSCTYLALAAAGYVLIKLIQTVFWLPGYLQKNQEKLEQLAKKYSVNLDELENESDLVEENNKKEIEQVESNEPKKDK